MTNSTAVLHTSTPAVLFTLSLPDEQATVALGAALAMCLLPGMTLYLNGELGAGKTALTRATLRALGHQGPVKSPTYALMESYSVPDPVVPGQIWQLRHFDLYRISDPREFDDAGFREEFNSLNICLVEWPQHGAGTLPAPDMEILLTYQNDGRAVQFGAFSEKGCTCINLLKSRLQP